MVFCQAGFGQLSPLKPNISLSERPSVRNNVCWRGLESSPVHPARIFFFTDILWNTQIHVAWKCFRNKLTSPLSQPYIDATDLAMHLCSEVNNKGSWHKVNVNTHIYLPHSFAVLHASPFSYLSNYWINNEQSADVEVRIFTVATIGVYTDPSCSPKSTELLSSSECRVCPSREAKAASRALLHTDKCVKPTSNPCYEKARRLPVHHTTVSLYKLCEIHYSLKPGLMFFGTHIKQHRRGFSGCTWCFDWGEIRAPHFLVIILATCKFSWTYCYSTWNWDSPEKRCKLNLSADSPKQLLFFSFFGQLNSKSARFRRSINLPTCRSHSSRTKTHSYAHIKRTGPGFVSEPRLYTLPGCCLGSFNCAISPVTVGTSEAASCFAFLHHGINLTLENSFTSISVTVNLI